MTPKVAEICPNRWRRLALATLVVAGCVGCRGSFEVVSENPLPPDVQKPHGIIILPVALMTHRSSAVDVGFRSTDVANWLIDHTEIPLFGVLDYKVFKSLDEIRIASADTDLVAPDGGDRRDLTGWWALQVLITENRSASVRNIVDTKRGTDGTTISRKYGIESHLQVEVTLRDAMRGGLKAKVVVVESDDATASPIEGEPRPVLARLLKRALVMIFGEALPGFSPAQRRIVRSKGLLISVPALAALAFPGYTSFDADYTEQSPTQREAALVSVWDRVAPGLDFRATMNASRNPGVLVRRARSPMILHDIILEVDGKPVRDIVQLDRQLQTCAPACSVKVQRKHAAIDLVLPWTSIAPPEDEE
jgi:hypothetical protein